MDAKKCDRCGKFYDKYGSDKQANQIRTVNVNISTPCKCDKRYDTCPDCMAEFERWLKYEDKSN